MLGVWLFYSLFITFLFLGFVSCSVGLWVFRLQKMPFEAGSLLLSAQRDTQKLGLQYGGCLEMAAI